MACVVTVCTNRSMDQNQEEVPNLWPTEVCHAWLKDAKRKQGYGSETIKGCVGKPTCHGNEAVCKELSDCTLKVPLGLLKTA